MRVALTVASLAASQGGPSRTVPALGGALHEGGAAVGLVACDGPDGALPLPDGVGLRVAGGAGRLRAGGFRAALGGFLDAGRVDVVHDHGVWLPSNHAAAAVARERGVPLVVSPRGMLEPWPLRHRAWKKRLAWRAYQQRDLRGARALHATSEMEAGHLRDLGLRQPIAVIPNGVHLPAPADGRAREEGPRTALFLSRIHPKKGLLDLVRAWAEVRPAGWRLVIAGPDECGHRTEVERAVAAAGLGEAVSFAGEVEGERKRALLERASLFVLPSYSENFGVAVAEALAAGVPVITTHGTPWAALEGERCGWWVPVGAAPLAGALRAAVALPGAERRARGRRGRALVAREFGWTRIGADMLAFYAWLLGGGPAPAFVSTR